MTPERFDIYDDQQNWIGTSLRSEVHAKGYWHRSFHCWIVRDEGEQRRVLFQRRRDIKDTFPGCYDITAAGHLTAGEQLQDASREPGGRTGCLYSIRGTNLSTHGYTAGSRRGAWCPIHRSGIQRRLWIMSEPAARSLRSAA